VKFAVDIFPAIGETNGFQLSHGCSFSSSLFHPKPQGPTCQASWRFREEDDDKHRLLMKLRNPQTKRSAAPGARGNWMFVAFLMGFPEFYRRCRRHAKPFKGINHVLFVIFLYQRVYSEYV
jgi:hypothetical protein